MERDGCGMKLRREVFAQSRAVWRPCNDRKASERGKVLGAAATRWSLCLEMEDKSREAKEEKRSLGDERESQERWSQPDFQTGKCLVEQKGTEGGGRIRLRKDLLLRFNHKPASDWE